MIPYQKGNHQILSFTYRSVNLQNLMKFCKEDGLPFQYFISLRVYAYQHFDWCCILCFHIHLLRFWIFSECQFGFQSQLSCILTIYGIITSLILIFSHCIFYFYWFNCVQLPLGVNFYYVIIN